MANKLLWTGLFILVGLPTLGVSIPLIGGIVMAIGIVGLILEK